MKLTLWSRCGGNMKVIAFLTGYAVVNRIIQYLNLTFVAERPPAASYRLPGNPDGGLDLS